MWKKRCPHDHSDDDLDDSAGADSGRGRLRQGVADVATMTGRELQHWRNRPGVVAFGWLFPVLVFAMFVGLLGGSLGRSGSVSYVDFVMPGMLAVTMFFGLESTMSAVSLDASRGVTERFRSLPVSGAAVLSGRCAADLLNSVVGLAVVVLAGLLFGCGPRPVFPSGRP